ncbi:MFS transporter, DHA1 family, bicyclomycin/chloramphenicol resistance protein [Chitinophaga ginsengisegetis]|uniref:MFS transporter, DHA1 family, bicyclomycin/chloramphenicol resistance protein n=1 Tax=Chitinophaga ginsengisegetis TaxID=393003 RepID=A0A1T5N8F0_9BACT|nr:multidrug effflux MFS transporter [Chitinophaga ginsengisegetis]SKC96594.1 MFS transporter, DHA1 family, bicyclomycin/chloramphenicol resistance protein [Chitinophaga ginsengisegetis]
MTNELSKSKYFFLILILGTLTALGPFSIDMYLPGFPAIGKDLGVDPTRVALSLSSFFIGISAGQLLYGPLLDRFGRKKPLYIGLVLYVISSIGCMYISSLNGLIILRFIQAIGSCAAAVASVAMVRDLFPVKDNAKVFALLMLVVGTSPMIAPTVGSYVTSAFSWHAVFLILGIMGALILIATILWLPESYQPDTSMSLKPGPIISNFLSVVSEPQFYTYTFAGAISFSGLFAYVSASPQVFMDIYKLSDKAYGWIFAGLSVGLIGSSQVNSQLLKRFSSQQIVPVALVCQTITGLIFIVCAWNNFLSLAGIIVLLFIYLCCLGFINPNTSALSLAPFSKNAGSASSLMGATQMGIGALASTVVSLYNTHTATPMAITMCGTSLLALFILLVCRRNIKTAVAAVPGAATIAH